MALEVEEFAARKLRLSLNDKQARQAIIADKAPRDILTSALPKVEAMEKSGIAYNALNRAQKGPLVELIGEYINRHRAIVATEAWTFGAVVY